MKSLISKIINVTIAISVAWLMVVTTKHLIVVANIQIDIIYSYLLFAVVFLLPVFLWLKIDKWYVKSLLIIILIISYLIGRSIAQKVYQTYEKSLTLMNDANSVKNIEWMNEKDPGKYMEGQRKYVSLLRTVSETPNPALEDLTTYHKEYYRIKKEIMEFDEKYTDSNSNISENELNDRVVSWNKELEALTSKGYVSPSWVSFFNIK
jgi:hypothetical protein